MSTYSDDEIERLADRLDREAICYLPPYGNFTPEELHYSRAAAMLRQLLEERRWRPIAEAPKDGTIVDLLHPDYGRITDCWWDSDDELWAGLPEEVAAGVTHFMRAPYIYPPQDGDA